MIQLHLVICQGDLFASVCQGTGLDCQALQLIESIATVRLDWLFKTSDKEPELSRLDPFFYICSSPPYPFASLIFDVSYSSPFPKLIRRHLMGTG